MDNSPRAARPWLGIAIAAGAVFGACWTASIAYWRASGSTPSGMAIGSLLLGLPAAIVLALWLAKKTLPARSAAEPATLPAAAEPARPRGPLPHIAAGAVRLRGGASLEELAEALRANGAPCELDNELKDEAGYPVLSGRADSCDPQAAREAMTPWLALRGMAELVFGDEQWRALAMGGAVVGELARHALMHPLLPDYLAAAPAGRAAIALPVLQLHLVLPARWQAGPRQAAADWLLHLVELQGWPAQRLMLSPASADDGFKLLDAVAQQHGLVLLVACESHVGEDSVRDWSERGILFSGRTPRGQVPGEGAAGLLLADAAQAAQLAQESLVTVHGACDGRRGVSADARGNIDSELLAGLGQQALQASKVEPADVTTLCADADLRPSRMGELMGMASTLLPRLEQSAQMMSVGACCGSAGAVGPLAALALAAHDALANGGQVLCVSNSDSLYRCALVLRPA